MTAATGTCPFCGVDGYVIGANATCYARLDGYPATPGHTLIVPKRHVESYFDLTPAEATDAHQMLWEVQWRINQEWQPDGYTIAVNDGRAAGRTVDHVHIHLIPRHFGDVPDPRGGIRRALPNGDPEAWLSDAEASQ
jgi:diadenosine tetraphosphate (Ap4A) HIT family hydrolase